MPRATDILPEVTPSMSPMMRQYVEIKSKHMDSILFFRLGDFYEMFYNDAVVASDELDLVLTKRANGEEEKAPMCGVPYHSCESYIARLVKKGYRVAICEQTEDPAKAKKLAARRLAIVSNVLRNEGLSDKQITPVLTNRDIDSFSFRVVNNDSYDKLRVSKGADIFGEEETVKEYDLMRW